MTQRDGFDFISLAVAPSSTMEVGVFGNRLFELRGGLRFLQATRASSIATHWNEQRKD
ncbi:MAG TPA: hypothetical protein VGJ90_08970 [Methylophilaceae bacterium]